ncbi:glutamate receptor U1-like [Parasteatoda tepidariorum]|uniref:glutamate receptor U1-like n=1 Tax=Parasteatoda tepidariorum TaxID=114398 RepID=UPI001C7286CF|nr:glutamate receptor ionotropic, delta-2-like [Parasteatoda tepidariorum]
MRKYRIRYMAWNPYVIIETIGNETKFRGLTAELYEAMKRIMNFNYEAILQPDRSFGGKTPDGEHWTGMIGDTIANETDLSGPYFIDEETYIAMKYAKPLGFSQLAIASGVISTSSNSFLVFQIITREVWLLLIVALVCVASTASIIFFLRQTISNMSWLKVLATYAELLTASLLGQNLGKKTRWYLRYVESLTSFRILETAWFLQMVLILMSTYKGIIISTFTTDKVIPRISTLEELMKDQSMEVKAFKGFWTEACFTSKYNKMYKSIAHRMVGHLVPHVADFSKLPAWIDSIEEGKVVFIEENVLMRNIIGERFKQTGKCLIRATPIDFGSAYIALAFNKDFPDDVKNKFDENILWFVEGGLPFRSFITSTLYYDICTKTMSSTKRALTLESLTGAFIVYGIGISISSFVFILEKLLCRRRNNSILWLKDEKIVRENRSMAIKSHFFRLQ